MGKGSRGYAPLLIAALIGGGFLARKLGKELPRMMPRMMEEMMGKGGPMGM